MSIISEPMARSMSFFHVASKSSFAIGDSQTLPFLGSYIKDAPILIYDLSEQLLFYDFMYHKDDHYVGRVRVAAESNLSSAVYSIETIVDFPDLSDIERRAHEELAKVEKIDNILGSTLVCYSYPKLGLKIKYQVKGKQKTAIYDIYENYLVASFEGDLPDLPEAGREQIDEPEGITVYSIMGNLLKGIDAWSPVAGEYRNLIRISSEILPEFGKAPDLEFTDADYAKLVDYFGKQPPSIKTSMLPIQLVGQQTPVYCAIASAKMILDFYGFSFTQDQIADAMHVGPQGTTNKDQISGYKQLSNNKLLPEFDDTPEFKEAMQMIDSLVPMKSGVPGHARVCRGWKKFTYFSPMTAEVQKEELWLLINDPYPVGQGSIRWENMDNHNYLNFIFLKRAT